MTRENRPPVIGVLAVQGAFIEHRLVLERLGAKTFEIRQVSDLNRDPAESRNGKFLFDGLVLPGGESTVQGKLLRDLDLFDPLKKLIVEGLPVLGTCAGLILLARKLSNDKQVYFGTLPVTVTRNAFGRQLGSFSTEQKMDGVGVFPMTFIRGPVISEVDSGMVGGNGAAFDIPKILASVDGRIVAVRYKNQLGLSFHPELTSDSRIHEYFLRIIPDN